LYLGFGGETLNREGHENVDFFTGIEVEKSPAYGLKTLFVVGLQPRKAIEEQLRKNKVQQIYFGTNATFDIEKCWEFEDMILPFLDEYKCCLDFDSAHLFWIVESKIIDHDNFLPMISLKMPQIEKLKNATLKLDDIDFEATNPGVWCHRIENLMSWKSCTLWDEYKKDVITGEHS